MRAFLFGTFESLFQMVRNEFGHLEHGNLLLAAKDSFQLFIRIDHALVQLVLELGFLDVFPDFFRDFSARQRIGADDSGKG